MGQIPQDAAFARNTPQARMGRSGGVAVLTLDNPTVNALSHGLRVELLAHIDEIEADGSIQAVVLTGAGRRTFCASRDVIEAVDAFKAKRPPICEGR